jgi:hypothetical protein
MIDNEVFDGMVDPPEPLGWIPAMKLQDQLTDDS